MKNLYPEINKALVHFISEAKRHNQIKEDSVFGGSPTRAGASPAGPLAQQPPAQSSTFGSFKMAPTGSTEGLQSAAQPSNMQLTKGSPA